MVSLQEIGFVRCKSVSTLSEIISTVGLRNCSTYIRGYWISRNTGQLSACDGYRSRKFWNQTRSCRVLKSADQTLPQRILPAFLPAKKKNYEDQIWFHTAAAVLRTRLNSQSCWSCGVLFGTCQTLSDLPGGPEDVDVQSLENKVMIPTSGRRWENWP